MAEPSYASNVMPKGRVPDSAVLAGTSAGGGSGGDGEGLGSWGRADDTEEVSAGVEVGVGVVEASCTPTTVGSAEGVTGGGTGCADDVDAGVGSGVATKVDEGVDGAATETSGDDTAISTVVEGITEAIVALVALSEVEVE